MSVEVRDVSGSAPGSTVLASQSVPASGVPPAAAFVSINFAAPAPVVAGTQYAIVAYSSTTPAFYAWAFSSSTNPYPGGGDFTNGITPPSGSWIPQSHDMAFKPYCLPATPTGTATG